MKRLLHLFLIIVIVLLTGCISGCGTFKKVFKLKESREVEIKTQQSTESTGLKIDKSVTTIKEKTDTTVTTPGRVLNQDAYLNMDSLVNGLTAVKNDLVDVRLTLNPITGVLRTEVNLKSQKIPVKIDRETTIAYDVSEKTNAASNKKEEKKEVVKSGRVENEPSNMGIWLLAVLIGLGLVVGAIWYWLKRVRV